MSCEKCGHPIHDHKKDCNFEGELPQPTNGKHETCSHVSDRGFCYCTEGNHNCPECSNDPNALRIRVGDDLELENGFSFQTWSSSWKKVRVVEIVEEANMVILRNLWKETEPHTPPT